MPESRKLSLKSVALMVTKHTVKKYLKNQKQEEMKIRRNDNKKKWQHKEMKTWRNEKP